ncbi:cell division protein ZapA [Heliorestis acidaminivorans]|uniref:Cell division protein ZapA n=1 Tax=Heliorestis acidaminivorans TaxID=553427 RepID=A0A6I0F0F5_9FIRM|nr:cell division protein ZapA [Heliorestis acidaminivorans]KAB2951573.1 cell division protein ZapA [Heliorestis acidaminivorans]
MSEEETYKATVRIYGEPYTIKGAVPPEHMQAVAALVDERMEQISRKAPHLSISKVAVLASFHLAHDLMKIQEDYDDLIKLLEDSHASKITNP